MQAAQLQRAVLDHQAQAAQLQRAVLDHQAQAADDLGAAVRQLDQVQLARLLGGTRGPVGRVVGQWSVRGGERVARQPGQVVEHAGQVALGLDQWSVRGAREAVGDRRGQLPAVALGVDPAVAQRVQDGDHGPRRRGAHAVALGQRQPLVLGGHAADDRAPPGRRRARGD